MNVNELKEILKKHSDWIAGVGGERASLWGADLQDADLEGADLRNANLWSANLWGADLQNANLQGADLRNANLQDADLQDANLQSADLRDANLQGANLQGANALTRICQSDLTILKCQKGKLRAFKYLDGLKSPYWNIEYKIGETYETEDYSDDERVLCAKGFNVATLDWCLRDTNSDLSKTYIEVEFDAKDIVAIPYNTDGKFRLKKMTVIRKIPKEELKAHFKPLYPNEDTL